MPEYDPSEIPLGERARIKEVKLDCLKDCKSDQDRTFKIRALFRRDRKLIGAATLLATMNAGTERLDAITAEIVHEDATADVGVVSGPEWWKGVDACEYDDVPHELYEKIEEWSAEFQRSLKKNKPV